MSAGLALAAILGSAALLGVLGYGLVRIRRGQ